MNKEEIKKKYFDLIEQKMPGAIPLLIVIVGSQAYGTNLPTSDFDMSGIFIQSKEGIYGFDYTEQIEEKKEKGDFEKKDKDDAVFYEIKRFLQLAQTANPTVLSILFSPDDCIIYKHPALDSILLQKNKFVTKSCKNSFAGYANSQIVKAKGKDKKNNWEKERTQRKTVLDFCFVPHNQGSTPIKQWLKERGLKQELCGLVNINHMKYMYGVFYDETNNKKYNGIVSNEDTSNDISLSSIENKNELPICHMQFNKDGYSTHCRDYREYLDYLKNRNTQRWVDSKNHGQKIDSKNIMHLVRLLRMSREIAENKEFIIRRPDAEYLKSIRKGEVDLQEIIDWAEKEIKLIDILFKESSLPENIDKNFVNDLLIDIRTKIYEK